MYTEIRIFFSNFGHYNDYPDAKFSMRTLLNGQ